MIVKERLEKLRALMRENNIDAYLVNGCDPHMSEYIPARWATRAFISGFTGSAGAVAITQTKAGLWTDSRYFLQSETELKGSGIDLIKMRTPGYPTIEEWIKKELKSGEVLGVDGETLPLNTLWSLNEAFASKNISINYNLDLLDPIWEDRPAFPNTIAEEHPVEMAGLSRADKLKLIRAKLADKGADLQIISALDDLAWTFNLRGQDVDYNPFLMAYAVVSTHEADLFCYPEKISSQLRSKLEGEGIRLHSYEDLNKSIGKISSNKTIYIDPARISASVFSAIPSDCPKVYGISIPCSLKACKSEGEIRNLHNVMQKDGVAMVKFLYWLDNAIGKEPLTEYSLVDKLDKFRREQPGNRGPSFFPIIGYAEHGAVVHIKVNPQNALPLRPEGIVIVDSGGQYIDGTTDLTRTIVLGPVNDTMKSDFTLVLKGMIALSEAYFPINTLGYHLDILARQFLWKAGLNYGHGTGHGIGYYLAVHEGPMSIRPEFNNVAIEAGMVMSNEPGLYREGKHGVRTENMMYCVEDQTTEFGTFLKFETLSLCPIDSRCIDPSLLTDLEKKWINEYHQRVYASLSPFLDEDHRQFLAKMTKEITQ
ncbi:MAG: aminopeptidase P family protein [Bacteroidota bacterium]|nr:aminopeptidase P family protein [Bacteroidota bacterium]